MKVVINTCYGGFGLSSKALEMLGGSTFSLVALPDQVPDACQSAIDDIKSLLENTLKTDRIYYGSP